MTETTLMAIAKQLGLEPSTIVVAALREVRDRVEQQTLERALAIVQDARGCYEAELELSRELHRRQAIVWTKPEPI